jgi:ABC-2 type transport system permease protein
MGKYLHVFSIGIQNTLVYRVNFLFRAAAGLIPLTGTLYLWKAVYAGKADGGDVAGYALSQMISYYLLITLVDAFTAVAEDDWQIAADIKDGHISQFLVRPINYLAYRFTLYLSGRSIYTTVAMVPVGAFLFLLREHFTLPDSPVTWLLFGASVVMAGLLQFMIACMMALLAFWVLDVSTFIFIQFAFEYIASGHLFPLDILPRWLEQLILLTPYPYLLYFPVGIWLGRIDGAELLQGLLIQSAWVAIGYLLLHQVWSRGVRRYSAVGG